MGSAKTVHIKKSEEEAKENKIQEPEVPTEVLDHFQGSSRKPASRIPTLPAFNKKCVSDSSSVPPRPCVPLRCATSNVTKLPSRLPVPKKPTRLAPIQNTNVKNTPSENNLSAAARRQKYHQSRHPGKSDAVPYKVQELPVTFHITGPSDVNCSSVKSPSIATTEITDCTESLNSRFLQEKKDKAFPRFQNNIHASGALPSVVQRQILPPVPVKPGVSPNSKVESQQSRKKKNLLGEFTHFPAVCNIFPSKSTKIISVTTIPSLPPILPPPPAPPPSISASLEQETGSKNNPAEPPKMEAVNNSDSAADVESGMVISDSTPSSENEVSSTPLASERRRTPFVHTISIVVEPVDISDSENGTTTKVDVDNIAMKSDASENIVKTVMDLARLRKEEFARLLEEHAQIVREIKRAEMMKM